MLEHDLWQKESRQRGRGGLQMIVRPAMMDEMIWTRAERQSGCSEGGGAESLCDRGGCWDRVTGRQIW